MTPDELAKIIAASLARHQSRGLVDAAAGMRDVVVHGRMDLTAVAQDLLAPPGVLGRPPRRSWAAWFSAKIEVRNGTRRECRRRRQRAEQSRSGPTPIDLALARLRMRSLDA